MPLLLLTWSVEYNAYIYLLSSSCSYLHLFFLLLSFKMNYLFLCQANLRDVAILSVPQGLNVEVPLQILFCSSRQSSSVGTVCFPRLVVGIEKGAELRLKQSFIGIPAVEQTKNADTDGKEVASLAVCCTRIVVAEGAKVKHTYEQDLPLTNRHLEALAADVHGNSSYDLSVLQMGARLGRVNAHIHLLSPLANCSLHGVTMAHTRQSLDLHSSILHDAEQALSRQQQRNVVGMWNTFSYL